MHDTHDKRTTHAGGSLFLFSANKRFIIKTLPAKEGRTLIRMLPAYYQHLVDNPQSLLCRLLGYYAIEGTFV
jgi:1-phosphatidylinositol-4-phosphate 5-kinase